MGPVFFVPTRNFELVRWLLYRGVSSVTASRNEGTAAAFFVLQWACNAQSRPWQMAEAERYFALAQEVLRPSTGSTQKLGVLPFPDIRGEEVVHVHE
jgi:hypothetical protein